ncbi:TauD/TfdA family dioxygenase [Parasphingopyxis sp.]|uniref:TauD/TfdA family dioxygenase n=1 Tax=Parasphingopyxis sp. TaxID=1920299 RepID=UPI002615D9F9|nr:TauD/TfdA family dioxygenase [Parasphingopyxis sp.]
MTDYPKSPITDKSAWTVYDLQENNSWQKSLSARAIEDLDRIVGDPTINFDDWSALRDYEWDSDAALPDLCKKVLAEVEDGLGFVILSGLPVDRYSVGECERALTALGSCMGDATSQNANGDIVGHVTDLNSDFAGDPDARGYTSSQELMPHADACDVLALFCVRQAKQGGESMLVSSMSIYNEILSQRPDLLPIAFRGFHHDLRQESVVENEGRYSREKWPVFVYEQGWLSAGYNAKTIRNAPLKGAPALGEDEIAFLDLFEETSKRDDLELETTLRPGDILFANNRTVLHSRHAYTDYDDADRKRLMLRLWLNVDEPRPLPESVLGIARGGVPATKTSSTKIHAAE